MSLCIERAFVAYSAAAQPVVDLLNPVCIVPGLHALIGPSGAGKSSVLKLIAGWFNGSAQVTTATSRISPGFSQVLYLSQESILLPWKKVRQSIELVCASFGVTVPMELVMAWLDCCELSPKILECYPAELSSGMAARCSLACGLAAAPQVLLIDETLALVQPALRAKMLESLKQQLSSVVLIATHTQDVMQRVEHCYQLSVQQGTARELVLSRGPSL